MLLLVGYAFTYHTEHAHCLADIQDDAEMRSMTVVDTWTGALSEPQPPSDGELSLEKLSLTERARKRTYRALSPAVSTLP